MPASGARLAAGLQAFSHPAIVRDGTVQVRLDMTHVDAEAFSLPLEAMGGISVFRGGDPLRSWSVIFVESYQETSLRCENSENVICTSLRIYLAAFWYTAQLYKSSS
ncbi:hypothetical protein [Sulfobacillus thermosulfidooxidans]|uniref:hypothetical protein n=1 Tax=Sulfobacillus thermosulfidooxidans TaxID=28034 RepID=UPI00096B954B|nr:hypothetical protein [Sulfobacillus thermosulfidooxidans]OLZ08048.1 hypothetical protein BFX05_04490 [Sulfobacillus thermosulfidooxidans]OLZ16462.1 hypothetical protein BFX06_14875 [Sulfobacillus thermosulfidooxidans]OLZ19549.1 hypothetical protein BFX07_02450 [Sulfobacillus thermosulfidooxidans]